MTPPPTPVSRPKLADWMYARNISVTQAAEHLNCSRGTVQNIIAPFDATSRTVPREALMERIVAWTGGAVTAGDFYPPHLRGNTDPDQRAREEVQ